MWVKKRLLKGSGRDLFDFENKSSKKSNGLSLEFWEMGISDARSFFRRGLLLPTIYIKVENFEDPSQKLEGNWRRVDIFISSNPWNSNLPPFRILESNIIEEQSPCLERNDSSILSIPKKKKGENGSCNELEGKKDWIRFLFEMINGMLSCPY